MTTLPAYDTFARTVSPGLGTADSGQTYTYRNDNTGPFSADGTDAVITASSGSANTGVRLNYTPPSSDYEVLLSWESSIVGNLVPHAALRSSSTAQAEYQLGMSYVSNNAWVIRHRSSGGVVTDLAMSASPPDPMPLSNEKWWIRARCVGTDPVTLYLRCWKDGTAEPTDWTLTAIDSGASRIIDANGPGFGFSCSSGQTGQTIKIHDFATFGGFSAAANFIFNTEATAQNFKFGALQTFTAPTPSGGATAGGSASHARERAIIGAGGAASSGSAQTALQALSSAFEYEGSGGAIAGGTAGVARTWVREGSGGATSSGVAIIGHVWARIGAGGATARGAASTSGPGTVAHFTFLPQVGPNFLFAGAAVNFLRPASDLVVGTWKTNDGSTADLYARINAVVPGGTFIRSEVQPITSKIKMRFSGPGTPPSVNTDHRFHIQYAKHGSETIDLTARILQGVTVIWQKTYPAIAASALTATENLSEAEAAQITDYDALDLELEVTTIIEAQRTPFAYSGTGGATAGGAASTFIVPHLILDLDFAGGVMPPEVSVSRALATATRITQQGYCETVPANEGRLNYAPDTLAPLGLLIEEARTNLWLQSDNLSSDWVLSEVTLAANADGTADAVTEAATTNEHYVRQNITKAASNLTYVVSAEIKMAVGSRQILLRCDGGTTSNNARATYNFTTGTVIGSGVSGTFTNPIATIASVGNGYWRITLAFTTGPETSLRPFFYGHDGVGFTYLGSTGVTWYYRKMEIQQVAAGFPAISYIPTTTAQATRNADVCVTSIGSLAGWNALANSSIVWGYSGPITTQQQQTVYQIDDDTEDNRVSLVRDITQHLRWQVVAGGVTQADHDLGIIPPHSAFRTAIGLSGNSARATLNGGAMVTDATVTVPAGLTTIRFGRNTTGAYLNGHLSRTRVYNAHLSDGELQAATGYAYPIIVGTGGAISGGAATTSYVAAPPTELLAFPGAKGFGRLSVGGRGGSILHVTNLNDSGAGSLRAAATASGARQVVFDVSGTINLLSNLSITNPYLTIAGETAPSPGIQLRGNQVSISTHNVIIRHLVIRVEGQTDVDDCIQMLNGAKNVIIDHCTAQWAGDECGSCNATGTIGGINNITWQECIFAESIEDGILLQSGPTNVTFYRSLLAKNHARSPRAHSNASFEVINCVMYNNGSTDLLAGMDTSTTANTIFDVSWINNRSVGGPNTNEANAILRFEAGPWAGNARIYYTGITQVNSPSRPIWQNLSDNPNPVVSSPPLSSGIVPVTADAAFETGLLASVGARPNDRDSAVTRLINEATTRTGANCTNADPGCPAFYGAPITYANNTRVYVPPTNPNGDDNGNGWTNIEEDFHQLAAGLL